MLARRSHANTHERSVQCLNTRSSVMSRGQHSSRRQTASRDRGPGPSEIIVRKDEAEIAKDDETGSFWKTPICLRLDGLS